VLYGRSIGTGPTVDLAADTRASTRGAHSPLGAAGVLLQSPIESGASVLGGSALATIGYFADIFCSYKKVARIAARTAIMHGVSDAVVPVANGEALFAKLQAQHPPLWMAGRGHNDMPEREVVAYAKQFVEAVLPDCDL